MLYVKQNFRPAQIESICKRVENIVGKGENAG